KERPALAGCRGPFSISPDGKAIACYRQEQNTFQVLVWELGRDAPRVALKPLKPDLVVLGPGHSGCLPPAWSPDGKQIAAFCMLNGYFVQCWDVSGQMVKERATIPVPFDAYHHVASLAYSPDGKTIAGASLSGVYVWDVAQQKRLWNWDAPGPL